MFPKTSVRKVGFGALAILALTVLPQQLKADFIPPYDVPTGFLQPFRFAAGSVTPVGSWTLQISGTPFVYPNSFVQYDPSQVILRTDGTLQLGSIPSLDLQFTHTILATGTLSFDYSLSLGTNSPLGANFGGYILDGVLTRLPAGTGAIFLPVRAGDVFAFEASAAGNCINCEPPFVGSATLTITHFNAPTPVPEPSVSLLCFFGAAAFLVIQTARRFRLRGRTS